MDKIRIIEVKEDVRANNDRAAEALRERLRDVGTLLINLMSSPGSGKTTLLSATLDRLADELAIGVMEADVDSDVDAHTVAAHGARAIQLHTGCMCHLDAAMCEQGLRNLGIVGLDLVFLENVGNLICPAEFDTGAGAKVMSTSKNSKRTYACATRTPPSCPSPQRPARAWKLGATGCATPS